MTVSDFPSTTGMVLCFDIGGTAIKVAEAWPGEPPRAPRRIPTPARDFAAFLAAVRGAVVAAGARPAMLAFSLAGIVDGAGRVTAANIPCLTGRRLREVLAADLDLPVVIANDADCFAMAEARVGAGRGRHVVLGIILGTGIGGGVVIGGRLINAGRGFAGEWGHGPVVAQAYARDRLPDLRCGCGRTGCLDAIASARGMERMDQDMTGITRTAEDILAAWQAGEAAALRTVTLWRDVLAGPLAMIVNLLGPDVVVAGGGLSANHALIAFLDEAVRAGCLSAASVPLVVPAGCVIEPGLIGAAALGRDALADGRNAR